MWYRLPSLALDIPMHDNLSGRAVELAHLNDLIRTSLSLADAAIPLLNEQLHVLAEMGIDNLELEGPRIYSRRAGWSPAFDDEQIIFAAALMMPGGLRCTVRTADDYATRWRIFSGMFGKSCLPTAEKPFRRKRYRHEESTKKPRAVVLPPQ